jgi:hypothetical protein
MHDPVYRVAVAWQNSSYNQPPHPGYYIASDMDFPPPALDVAAAGSSDNGNGTTSVVGKGRPHGYSINMAKTSGGALRVSYSLKDKGDVRIDVFDIKGSKVRTLVNTSKSAGTYREQFSVGGLAAGMYIVKMRVGKQALQERFTIAR